MPKAGVPILTAQNGNTPVQGALSVWSNLGTIGNDITPGARWMGATASGAPVTGKFAKGDFVTTQDGHVFICTVAGTPGTWTNAGGGSGGFSQTTQVVVGAPTATITLTPSGTTSNLKITLVGRGDVISNYAAVIIRFNGDTGLHYDEKFLWGDGVTAKTQDNTNIDGIYCLYMPGASAVANASSQHTIDVLNYRGTAFFKSVTTLGGGPYPSGGGTGGARIETTTGGWRSTAAITSVVLSPDSDNFIAGTTATLYEY